MWFTAAYMVAAIIGSVVRGNREFVFYIVVMFCLFALVSYVHWRVRLLAATLWALTLWGFAHMAGGLVPVPESWPINGESRVLYSLWIIPGRLKFDQIVHAYGFGVTTWVCCASDCQNGYAANANTGKSYDPISWLKNGPSVNATLCCICI